MCRYILLSLYGSELQRSAYVKWNADVLHDVLCKCEVVGTVKRGDLEVVDLRDTDADQSCFIEATDEDLLEG